MSKADVAIAYSMAFDKEMFARKEDYECQKCGVVHCPNSYSYLLCFRLDADPNVVRFRHKTVRFEYYHPEHEAVEGAFFDFDVDDKRGRRLLYVTAQIHLHTPVEEAMLEAADSAAHDLGAKFEVWTEVELFGPNPEYAKSVLNFYMNKLWRNFPPTAEELSYGDYPTGPRNEGGRRPKYLPSE